MRNDALYVGLMSGTSADGIDAALVSIENESGSEFELVAFETTAYPNDLKQEILSSCDARTGTVDLIARLDAVLGQWFANAALSVIASADIDIKTVRAIGSHGQTVHHLPDAGEWFGVPARSTLQIGNASVIAEQTGIQTVSDFRSRDVAVGGQGAPLVPLIDYLVFADPEKHRALLNVGGIANVTVLPVGGGLDSVTAFDTGPGNVIIDGLVHRMTDGAEGFDQDGRIALGARIHEEVLRKWLSHPYFELQPPRSTGREVFGGAYVDALIERHADVPLPDLIATATAFTAEAVAESLRAYTPDFDRLDELHVSGGGSLNPFLMSQLQERLGQIQVGSTDDLGLSAEAKEAVAFAILAHRTLNGLPGNVPSATGASHPVVLGQITPAP
ncbi:MAG: anhydro-N-acetylmuramic acid kinase [Gemmatimonadetes bacterium]|nr:anhydro-N-acetylmuramic acid kinase [Gemmatimonadota bacterium]